MNLLFIAEVNHYKNWIGKTYYDILTYYKVNSKNNIKLIYTDEKIVDNIKDIDIIVFFDTDTLRFAGNYSYLFDLNIPIYACSLDFFNFNECINCNWIKKCSGLLHFGYSSKLLNSYKKHFNNKIIKCFKGRFVNTNRFKNYNLEKKYDILIYGTRNYINNIENHDADIEYKNKWEKINKTKILQKHDFYPLRKKIENILIKNYHKYNLKILKSSCIYDAVIANEDLSKLINESWLTLSCCTRADIPMSKYFEISASYSGILGDIPSDYYELFKDSIVYVSEWMNEDEILSIIDNALSNKKKLGKMINNLGNKIHKEYNLDSCVENMDDIFDELNN